MDVVDELDQPGAQSCPRQKSSSTPDSVEQSSRRSHEYFQRKSSGHYRSRVWHGRYLALLLAQDGADVCVCDVNEETLNETVEMLRPYSVSVSSQVLDVADKAAVEALPGKVIEQHGKVDLVFNNAGVSTVSTSRIWMRTTGTGSWGSTWMA